MTGKLEIRPLAPCSGYSLAIESGECHPDSLGTRELEIFNSIGHAGRRNQFALGRKALHEALKSESFSGDPDIGRDDSGLPLFPPGFRGSISHCNIYSAGKKSGSAAVAAAARQDRFISLGVDVEHLGRPLNPAVKRQICCESELSWATDEAGEVVTKLLMLVCAKEALFKLLNPETKVFFGMQDAELHWRKDRSLFEAVLKRDLAGDHLAGKSYEICLSTGPENLLIAFCAVSV